MSSETCRKFAKLKRVLMDDSEAARGVGSRIAGAGRQPSLQFGQRRAGSSALPHIIPRVTNVLVHDAVSIQVRRITHVAIPSPVMPCQPYRKMRRHIRS